MMKLVFCVIFLSSYACAQVPKLLISGEHVGFKTYYYENGQEHLTTIQQGEEWYAVYRPEFGNRFRVRTEVVRWDSTFNKIIIRKDSSIQPSIYFQGFKPAEEGLLPDISFLVWNWNNKSYCVIEKNNPLTLQLQPGFKQELILDSDTMMIYKNELTKNVSGAQILLRWAGDLNGDGELDFLIKKEFRETEENIFDLILSIKNNSGIKWNRFARFHEWN